MWKLTLCYKPLYYWQREQIIYGLQAVFAATSGWDIIYCPYLFLRVVSVAFLISPTVDVLKSIEYLLIRCNELTSNPMMFEKSLTCQCHVDKLVIVDIARTYKILSQIPGVLLSAFWLYGQILAAHMYIVLCIVYTSINQNQLL